jgi:hypothetical protein
MFGNVMQTKGLQEKYVSFVRLVEIDSVLHQGDVDDATYYLLRVAGDFLARSSARGIDYAIECGRSSVQDSARAS